MFARLHSMTRAAATLLCLLACAPLHAQAPAGAPLDTPSLPLPVLVQRCSPAVVLIEAQLSSATSQGSGVILDATGKVLTCNHVVRGAKSVLVKTGSGGYFPAEGLLGVNPSADIALLRLRSQGLPTVPIGDAGALLQGEKVFVISAAAGLENTVGEGIVSGLRRVSDLPSDLQASLSACGFRGEQMLLQFTAPTSPGSSGGAVFNARGEVVGIVAGARPWAENVYLAIPARLALPHLPSETVLKFEEASPAVAPAAGAAPPELTELSPSVGLLPPVEVSGVAVVPKGADPTIHLEEGRLVLAESVVVSYARSNEKLVRVTRQPAAREFQSTPGGVLLFSSTDKGQRVLITYTYQAQRVALLPSRNQSSSPEVVDMFREALRTGFADGKYEVIPVGDVDAAAEAVGVSPARGTWGQSGVASPEEARAIAARTNAAILVFSTITAESWVGAWTKGVRIEIALRVLDGHSGEDLYAQDLKNYRYTWGTNKGARASLVRSFADTFVKEFRGKK